MSPKILDIGRQGGRDTALSFDKVKFERLTNLLVYRSNRRFQRNNRRSVLALLVAPRTCESVDVDNAVEALTLTHNGKPSTQIRAEDLQLGGCAARRAKSVATGRCCDHAPVEGRMQRVRFRSFNVVDDQLLVI
jgi:hypothetical protein